MIKDIPSQLRQNVDPLAKSRKDNLYQSPRPYQPFQFDQPVVDVFPDMIGRSVPGYWLNSSFLGLLTKRFAQESSNVYDLGCSLGATTYSILQQKIEKKIQLIAIDSSKQMVDRLLESLAEQGLQEEVCVHHADIKEHPLENASVVVLNYVLQFIPPSDRDQLLTKIYRALRPGGVLLLSEKVRFDDPAQEARIRAWHHDFKAAAGYTSLEIEQKARAIRQVMQTDSLPQLQDRLRCAGFSHQSVWMQCYSFISLVVEK